MTEIRAAYGPNTPLIRRFLQRLAALTPGDESEIADRYAALATGDAFRAADAAVALLIAGAGRDAERDAMAGPLLQLVRARVNDTQPTNRDASGSRPIAEPALAALLALLMHDLLPPKGFKVLYQSFEPLIAFDSLR